MRNFDIRTVEKATGIKAHTIRIWESRYSLIPPARTIGNRRLYDGQQVSELLDLALLTRYGSSVSKVIRWSPVQRRAAINQLLQTSAAAEVMLHELLKAFYNGDADQFEVVTEQFSHRFGLSAAITRLTVNFLDRTSHYDLKSSGGIARLMQNMLRNKIIVALQQVNNIQNKAGAAVIISLGKNHSELEVLITCYILRSAGNNAVYIEPLFYRDGLAEILLHYRPRLILGYVSTPAHLNQRELLKLASDNPFSKVVVLTSPLASLEENDHISYLDVLSVVDHPKP